MSSTGRSPSDSRPAEQTGWDRELLALEVADVAAFGIDPATLGFGPADLCQEDTPEPLAVPISRPGDLCEPEAQTGYGHRGGGSEARSFRVGNRRPVKER